MSSDYFKSQDTVKKLLNDSVKGGSQSIFGYIPRIEWEGLEYDDRDYSNRTWLSVNTETLKDSQNKYSGELTRVYEVLNLVRVILFCPKHESGSYRKGQMLALICRDAFRSKSKDCVWFRDTTFRHMPVEDKYFKFAINSYYTYDERVGIQ